VGLHLRLDRGLALVIAGLFVVARVRACPQLRHIACQPGFPFCVGSRGRSRAGRVLRRLVCQPLVLLAHMTGLFLRCAFRASDATIARSITSLPGCCSA
jgi:hypothetical protein